MEGGSRKVPVVYYLCRNMNLEQPHFVEVPCSSDGLYLRDVMNRLNLLRGQGMAAMYSWSCKRCYKSGFVWQDLGEEDLIIPAQGSEYVLKGSERLNTSPSEDRAKTPKSCPELVVKEVNSPWRSSLNASTQTDKRPEGTNSLRTRGVSTEDSSLEIQFLGGPKIKTAISKDSSEINAGEISPPPTSSSASSSGGFQKTETLETLIRADAKKTASFRAEEEVSLQTAAKLKATEVLMQLITCGSIAVKDSYGVGAVSSYRPRISRAKLPSPSFSSSRLTGDLDGLVMENPRTRAGRRIEEKVFFSGSLLETKNGEGKFVPSFKRSSSYNEERSCKSPEREKGKKTGESGKAKGSLRRTMKNEEEKKTKSPKEDGRRISTEARDGFSSRRSSKRFTEASSPAVKTPSSRTESFREVKEKIVKIEERLTSGARVVIHSTATCHESEDSSSS